MAPFTMPGICPSFLANGGNGSDVVPLRCSLRLALLLTWHVCAARRYAILLVYISRNIEGASNASFSVILAKMWDELPHYDP